MARRTEIDHKELKEPDAFMEGVGQVVTYVRENRVQVIGSAVAVTALFLGITWWVSSSARHSDTTAAAFLRATDALESDNLAAADAALRNVADAGVAPYDEFASLYSAEILVRKGENAQAAELYGRVAENGTTPYLRQIALVGRAYALEADGDSAAALESYQKAATIDGPYREPALRGQLRLAESAERGDLAEGAITKLLEDYPSSPDADDLSARLTALRDAD
jgi:hypothetical protein